MTIWTPMARQAAKGALHVMGCHGMSCFVMRAAGTPLRYVMGCHVLHVVGTYAVVVSGITRACPPSRRAGCRMHTSPPGRVALHVLQPSPRPPSRGPSMIPDAAATGGEQAEPSRLPREPRLAPGSGAGVTNGGGARRGRNIAATTNRRDTRPEGGPPGEPALAPFSHSGMSFLHPVSFLLSLARPAMRRDPYSRAIAGGRGRVSAPARFARLIARARA